MIIQNKTQWKKDTLECKKVPLVHTDKEKRLIEEANQRIRESQVEQAKGAIRSANFIALNK